MNLKIKNHTLFALTFLFTQGNIANALTQSRDCNGNHCPETNCESDNCKKNIKQPDCEHKDCEQNVEYFSPNDNKDIENCLKFGTFSDWKMSEDINKNLVTYYAFAKNKAGSCSQYIVRYQFNKITNSWETLPEKVIEIKN